MRIYAPIMAVVPLLVLLCACTQGRVEPQACVLPEAATQQLLAAVREYDVLIQKNMAQMAEQKTQLEKSVRDKLLPCKTEEAVLAVLGPPSRREVQVGDLRGITNGVSYYHKSGDVRSWYVFPVGNGIMTSYNISYAGGNISSKTHMTQFSLRVYLQYRDGALGSAEYDLVSQ